MKNNPIQILEEISNVPGKNDKFELLKQHSDNTKLAELLNAALNFNRTYHIKKFNENQVKCDEIHDNHLYFVEVVLDKLENRHWTGNTAIELVENFFKLCDPLEQKWYARILRKDLKAGFSDKTAVEAGFKDIPLFDVMLAKDGGKQKNLDKLIEKGVYVSPKLDGYRCLAVVNEGEVSLYSRNGTKYLNFPDVVQSLKTCFPTGKYVFDGEIMSDDFQAMQKSAFANKRQTTVGDVHYAIFGYIPYKEWTTNNFEMSTTERIAILNDVSQHFDSRLKLVDQAQVFELSTVYSLQACFELVGYEGAMVLPDLSYYKGRKTGGLLKFKKMLSQDCVVTGMYEGNSKYTGMMGGVVVRQENGLECEVGSGWKDEDRQVMWANQELYIGNIIEVKYQELTKDGVMRFPIFMRWRSLDNKSGKI